MDILLHPIEYPPASYLSGDDCRHVFETTRLFVKDGKIGKFVCHGDRSNDSKWRGSVRSKKDSALKLWQTNHLANKLVSSINVGCGQ